MEVAYQRPTKNDRGLYVFQGTSSRDTALVYAASIDDLAQAQERILDATDSIVGSLRDYPLPQEVNGIAKVSFLRYDAMKPRFPIPTRVGEHIARRISVMRIINPIAVSVTGYTNPIAVKVGELGFPYIEIETELGNSYLLMWPSKKGVSINFGGSKLALQALTENKEGLEEKLGSTAVGEFDPDLSQRTYNKAGRLTIPLSFSSH